MKSYPTIPKETNHESPRSHQTIETLGGYKFIRRYLQFNLDTNRTETAYVFKYNLGATLGTRDDLQLPWSTPLLR